MKSGISGAALAIALAVSTNVVASGLSADDEQRVKQLAIEAILENPEVIQEAVAILRQRQEEDRVSGLKRVLESRREDLERDPNAPVLGNPDGDVTIVEFFDYNCPYCKQVAGDVKRIIENDDDVRLVYREWPILGPGSVFAARAALASRKQGKYEEMHWALMEQRGRITEQSTIAVAERLGLDIEQLRRDMESEEIDQHIALSHELTRALGFSGTPSFVIGDQVAPGLIPYRQIQSFVAAVRKRN